jgi:hypothetical protein
MLRRSKDHVLSLPPKLRTWLSVEVPKGTGVRDMTKVVELLVSQDKVAPDRPSAITVCADACCTRSPERGRRWHRQR